MQIRHPNQLRHHRRPDHQLQQACVQITTYAPKQAKQSFTARYTLLSGPDAGLV